VDLWICDFHKIAFNIFFKKKFLPKKKKTKILAEPKTPFLAIHKIHKNHFPGF